MNDKEQKTYLFSVGDSINIKKTVIDKYDKHYVFYSTNYVRQTRNGKTQFFKVNLDFNPRVDLEDGLRIKILSFHEDLRMNTKNYFEPMFYIVIDDFVAYENGNIIDESTDDTTTYEDEEARKEREKELYELDF